MSIPITQKQFIRALLEKEKGSIIIGSLGTISRDLKELDNGKNTVILVRGNMGGSLGISLGYALNTKKKVINLIGDGSLLMKMGSMATILKYKPKNLKIIILNNNSHESCGGQETNFKYAKDWVSKFCRVIDVNKESRKDLKRPLMTAVQIKNAFQEKIIL